MKLLTQSAVLAGLLLCAVSPARAASSAWEGIAGWEGDSFSQGYGFLALGWLPCLDGKWSLPWRLQGSYLYYNFAETGGTTHVRSPGAGISVGLRREGSRGSVTVFVGGEVRSERRENAGSVTNQDQTGGAFQLEANWSTTSRLHALVLGNYSTTTQYLWSRLALRYQVTNPSWEGPVSTFLGLEGVRQGNDESDSWQGGGFLEWNLVVSRMSFSLHGGYKETWSPGQDHRRGAYVGLSLYHRF